MQLQFLHQWRQIKNEESANYYNWNRCFDCNSYCLTGKAFGNSISVKDVKEGYLTYFSESKTIGSAFDNYTYFDDISWEGI